jgi:hypothetical protein
VIAPLLLVLTSACGATPASPPSAIAIATPAGTARPTATPTAAAGTPATFATVCGTISDFVSDSGQTNGSFVLNSPGRAPIRITIPAGRVGGVAANYVCAQVRAGVPYPLFDGFFTANTPGFIDSGSFPATAALPAPTGFEPPQACAYVAAPVVGADQTDWTLDCGSSNSNARAFFGAALAQQGWTSCGSGLAAAQWRKNNVTLGVVESSLAPGDYPRLTQYARVTSPCS